MLTVYGCAYQISAAGDSLQFGVIVLSKFYPLGIDEYQAYAKLLRISDDINTRYADAFRTLAKSEAKDRENELLFGFERNAWKNQT